MSTDIPSSKRLPMIVDIAIGDNGKQMYQVHETSKFLRKEMPKSTNFSISTHTSFDLGDSRITPTEMSTGVDLPFLHFKRKGSSSETSLPDVARGEEGDFDDQSETPDSSQLSSSSPSDNIWSKDVQNAFEEVLAIVPKNGLNKIKIGGRSCGRNELISDYILAKTGKFRSRKQVSSHIQVIKNMGLKKRLIQLISDGPTFSSQEESDENAKRFEEIFTKINLSKSLGFNSMVSSPKPPIGQIRRHSSEPLGTVPKRRKLAELTVGVRKICFSIKNLNMGTAPIYLSIQEEAPPTSLTIKENAAMSNRFPGLEEFANTDVPIIHNMVRIHSPLQLPNNFDIETGLETRYMLELGTHLGLISSFTTVYSFGNEVLKMNEDDFQVNTYQPFLLKFWKCFFLQLLHQPASLDVAFKGITVKQIIYNSIPGPVHIVPKNEISAVLIWEFAKVDDFKLAKTTTSRLFLPQSLSSASSALFENPAGYYVPLTQAPMSIPVAAPLEYDPLYCRSGSESQLGGQDMDLNFLSQGHFPMQGGLHAAGYPQPYSYSHPSVNVNLGSIRVKEEMDDVTFSPELDMTCQPRS